MLGLETMGNRHQTLDVSDVFGKPQRGRTMIIIEIWLIEFHGAADASEAAECVKRDLHSAMEARLGMDMESGSVFHRTPMRSL